MSEALAQRVPETVAEDGVLRIGTDPSYKPMEYVNGDQQLTGLEIQLVMAVAQKLGLTPWFDPEAFTAVEAGVRADRFELGAAALTVPPGERLTTDAVLYLPSGVRLARHQGSALQLSGMCGARIAALEGSRQLTALGEASERCEAAGSAPIIIVAFLTQEDVTRAVLTRSAEGMVADAPVVQSAVHSYPAELDLAPGEIDPAPFALLAAAGSELSVLVAAAIDELIADGRYDEILAGFGVKQGAAGAAVVLPAGEAARQGMPDTRPIDEPAVP